MTSTNAWIRVAALAAVFAAAAAAGCSEDKKGSKACPPGGLGNAAFEGVSIADQLANWDQYDCKQPQVCPDRGFRNGTFSIDSKTEPLEASFILRNCTTGGQTLEITKVVVYGDQRCAFEDVTDAYIERTSVPPGETTVLRTVYKTDTPGTDYAEIRVYSNASNNPGGNKEYIDLPLCITAYTPQTGDAGVQVDDGGAAVTPPPPECRDEPNVNTSCHKN